MTNNARVASARRTVIRAEITHDLYSIIHSDDVLPAFGKLLLLANLYKFWSEIQNICFLQAFMYHIPVLVILCNCVVIIENAQEY